MKNSDEIKEMISIMINIATRVITMIFVIISVFYLVIGDADLIKFSLEDICGILVMGLASGLAFGLFYIKKNTTTKQSIVIHIIYFSILNVVLLLIGLHLGWFRKELSSLISMEIMFVAVYAVVTLLVYLFDFNEAKKINQKLNDRKKL